MRQVLQSLSSGNTEVPEVPRPLAQGNHVLIRTRRSLISTGTERMVVQFGKAGLLEKARQQPDKVRMVLEKARSDGLFATIEAVLSKLDQPLPLGYCNAGIVEEVGHGVAGFVAGDRVASNGNHAEFVNVPGNLCAKIPQNVTDDEAAFTPIGAIGLQGIRLLNPALGESIVVVGLGLVGLVSVQLLRAHGCRVLGIDFDPARLELARGFGAEVVDLSSGQSPTDRAIQFSRGRGVDGVLIAASTESSEPIHQAALMCRKRGRIVLVGVAGLELSRADFYDKELTFQVSCSYGPGRYDSVYEIQGQDYPIGFVRWTAQRNFEAILDMIADGRLDVRPLISHRFDIAKASDAYALMLSDTPSLGIILDYPEAVTGKPVLPRNTAVVTVGKEITSGSGAGERRATVSFVGAGNYACGVLIPAFKGAGARLKAVASKGGVTGFHAARKFGFSETTTDAEAVFADNSVDAVVVSTRHDSHARFVLKALEAGKSVFVEKPLAISMEELSAVSSAVELSQTKDEGRTGKQSTPIIMVGFNRRFAPQTRLAKRLLDAHSGPKSFVLTVNAGHVPQGHWTLDPEVGGGRIVGEACHFVDLLRYLAAAPIEQYDALAMKGAPDTVTISLKFADGSIGAIHYFSNGHRSVSKERLEIFSGGRILILDNFLKLSGFGWPGFRGSRLWKQDKGQKACVEAFLRAVADGHASSPIPFDQVIEVSRVTIELARKVAGSWTN